MISRNICIVVLLTALSSLTGCAAFFKSLSKQKPSVTVENARLQSASLRSIELELKCKVHNPYSVSIPAIALKYRVWIADVPLSKGTIRLDSPVPARGSAPIFAVLRFGPLNAVKVAGKLARGNRKYRVKGEFAPFGEMGVSIKKEGTLKGSLDRRLPISGLL